MARKYDIIERLKAKNERPFVMIDEDHTYTINTSKTNVMNIMAVIQEFEKDKGESEEDDMKMMDKIVELSLGKDALEYISSLDLTLEAYKLIFDVIMAAISGEELDDESKDKEEVKK